MHFYCKVIWLDLQTYWKRYSIAVVSSKLYEPDIIQNSFGRLILEMWKMLEQLQKAASLDCDVSFKMMNKKICLV